MHVTDETKSLIDTYVLPSYGRFPLELVRGEGCRVWDSAGKCYLDFGAGIAVCSLGHAHPAITAAVSLQAATLVHTSNLYYTAGQAKLAKRLVESTGTPGRVFFSNSGAEANEGLIKLARKYGHATTGGTSRHRIITFHGSFHGRTMAGISATAQDKVKHGFEPLLSGFLHLPFGDLEAVRQAADSSIAAILIEPVQGEGGIHLATAEFLRGLRDLCDATGILLLFDEVQCGLGRTGTWSGWKSVADPAIQPDGISWAKGIAGGFPLGAFYVREKEFENAVGTLQNLPDIFGPGTHGTTYGGNPLVCAAGNAVFDVIEKENLLEHTRELGSFTLETLRAAALPWVKEVRGVGLMIGIQLDASLQEALPDTQRRATPALSCVELLHNAGLLSIPAGPDVIRWLPPLNVKRAEIEEAVSIFSEVLRSIG